MCPFRFVQAITYTFMHGSQNKLAQFFFLKSGSAIWNICSGRLKVKIILEGQMIKWSLISVNIINSNFLFINIKKKKKFAVEACGFCESFLHLPRSIKQMAGSTSCPWTTILAQYSKDKFVLFSVFCYLCLQLVKMNKGDIAFCQILVMKIDNFCDFLFASLKDENFPKKDFNSEKK